MDNKSISPVNRDPRELLVEDHTSEIHEVARKIMKLTPGGRKLTADQAAELAVYCYIAQANPFEGEAHYMQNVGPVPGIALYRRRAREYLDAAYGPHAKYRIKYRPATHSEAYFDDDKGDIAWVAELIDSIEEGEWLNKTINLYQTLTKSGMEHKLAWDTAERKIGPLHKWIGVGVVQGAENFGYEKKIKNGETVYVEGKFDRNERAQKRAEKQAIKKAYSWIQIPDRELGDELDEIVIKVADKIAAQIPEQTQKKTTTQLLEELGFSVDESEEAGEVIEGKAEEQPKEIQDTRPTLEELLVNINVADNIHNAKAVVKLLGFTDAMGDDEVIRIAKSYRGWRDVGLGTKDAAKQAQEGKIPDENDGQLSLLQD